jgi:hypothetical protein
MLPALLGERGTPLHWFRIGNGAWNLYLKHFQIRTLSTGGTDSWAERIISCASL